MEKSGKYYTVKEWFANKVAQEVRSNINMCDVFAIMKETDKAVYAMLNIGCHRSKSMWVPKSVLVENNPDHRETIIESDYNTCLDAFHYMWKDYE